MTAAVAALCGYHLLGRVLPWLRAKALAHPNHRSSHANPTPQGAGIVVIPVAIALAAAAVAFGAALPGGGAHAATIALAGLGLTLVGFADDCHHLPILPRLAAQGLAAALVVLTFPSEIRLLPQFMPWIAERALLVVGVLWFINAVNFMDGMDGISALETAAITLGVILLALLGTVPAVLGWWAAALLGAMLGFVPWNAPPARVFLGDAGSIPLGLLLAALLLHVAAAGATAAAALLPLYYIADATLTLVGRVARGERPWEPHREHFYQRARRRGLSVRQTLAQVACLNIGLIVLALLATAFVNPFAILATVAVAVLLVVWTLRRLAAGDPTRVVGD